MRIIFETCKNCLVRASCSHVCQETKNEVESRFDMGVECDVSLEVLIELLEKTLDSEGSLKEDYEFSNENVVASTINGGFIPHIEYYITLEDEDG